MNKLSDGAKQAVENCIKLQAGEKVIIITDKASQEIGHALEAEAKKISPDVLVFIMEDFGERPLEFPDELKQALGEAEVSIYAAQGAPGELQTFRQPMLKAVDANPKLRHAHMIGITKEIMRDGMCSDYQEVQRIGKLVDEKVKNAKEIRVRTIKGTDLLAEFSPDLKWIVSDGFVKADNWTNLPDGENFTCPKNINGIAVIDGCLGDYFTEKYGTLKNTPITIKIKNGRAVKESIECSNQELKEDYIKYLFETDENSTRVGEFAIGTNIGLSKIIGNLLQDEKFPGVHIAFGSPFPTKTGASWDSKGHLDGVIRDTDIFVDGEQIMEKGKFLF